MKQKLNELSEFSYIVEDSVINYSGRVIERPYQRGSKQVITIDNFRLYTDLFDEYKVGDLIEFSGKVDKRVIMGEMPTFYLYEANIKVRDDGAGNNLFRFLYWWKGIVLVTERLEVIFAKTLSEPHASLLAGVVLGVRKNIPANFYEMLVASGTLHVIAASGFNITIIAKVLLDGLAQFLHRRVAVVVATGGVVFYTLLAGASPAVVRAAIMGILAFVAQALGKDYLAKWALVVSAGLMLLVDPLLVGDAGFQLSVAATAGILWLQGGIESFFSGLSVVAVPLLESLPQRVRSATRTRPLGLFQILRQDLSTTLAATVGTLPITLITFDQVSVVSPVVNAVVLWLVAPMMALGGVIVIIGLIWLKLAQMLAWLAWPLLELFIQIVSFFGKLPFASWEIEGVGWLFGAGYYLVLICIVGLKFNRE